MTYLLIGEKLILLKHIYWQKSYLLYTVGCNITFNEQLINFSITAAGALNATCLLQLFVRLLISFRTVSKTTRLYLEDVDESARQSKKK